MWNLRECSSTWNMHVMSLDDEDDFNYRMALWNSRGQFSLAVEREDYVNTSIIPDVITLWVSGQSSVAAVFLEVKATQVLCLLRLSLLFAFVSHFTCLFNQYKKQKFIDLSFSVYNLKHKGLWWPGTESPEMDNWELVEEGWKCVCCQFTMLHIGYMLEQKKKTPKKVNKWSLRC